VRDPKVRLRRLSEIATNPPPGGLLCFWGPVLGKTSKFARGHSNSRAPRFWAPTPASPRTRGAVARSGCSAGFGGGPHGL